MLIKVTNTHIQNGRPGECNGCPIKLAFESLGFQVKVDIKEVIYNGNKHPLPKPAIHFIDNYDNHRDVEPFEFEMLLNGK